MYKDIILEKTIKLEKLQGELTLVIKEIETNIRSKEKNLKSKAAYSQQYVVQTCNEIADLINKKEKLEKQIADVYKSLIFIN